MRYGPGLDLFGSAVRTAVFGVKDEIPVHCMCRYPAGERVRSPKNPGPVPEDFKKTSDRDLRITKNS